jgi:hypothetical protein
LKSQDIEDTLLKKEAILKCVALLANLEFRSIRRDINAWEIGLKKLDKGFKNLKNLKKIKQIMQEKITKAERVMLEAQKMRLFDAKMTDLLQVKTITANPNSRIVIIKKLFNIDQFVTQSQAQTRINGSLFSEINNLRTGLEFNPQVRTQLRSM